MTGFENEHFKSHSFNLNYKAFSSISFGSIAKLKYCPTELTSWLEKWTSVCLFYGSLNSSKKQVGIHYLRYKVDEFIPKGFLVRWIKSNLERRAGNENLKKTKKH